MRVPPFLLLVHDSIPGAAVCRFLNKSLLKEAAALAFFFMLAAVPAISLLLWTASQVASFVLADEATLDRLRQAIVVAAGQAFPFSANEVEAFLRTLLVTPQGAGPVAAVAMLFAAGPFFKALAVAASSALDLPPAKPFRGIRLAAILLAGGGSVLLLFLFLLGRVAFGLLEPYGLELPRIPSGGVAGFLFFGIPVMLVFLVLGRLAVGKNLAFRWLLPGALVFWLGWEVGAAVMGLYLHQLAALSTAYGSLTSFALILVWTYSVASIFMFGLCVSRETELFMLRRRAHRHS
jgi:membrane protein